MRLAVAACLIVIAAASGASARQPAPSPPAADVRGQTVTGLVIVLDGVPTTDRGLAQLLDVAIGRPLDPAQVRSSIEHFVHMRRFATVDVYAEPTGTGVLVRVELASVQRIGEVRVDGALRQFGGDIVRAVRERLGSSALASDAGQAVGVANDVLGSHGFLRPQTETRIETTKRRDVVTLVLTGDPGPRWHVGQVTVTGVPQADRSVTVAALDIRPGMPYDRDSIDRHIERYTHRLREAGYYEAVVRTTPVPGQDETSIDMTVDVARGPLVSLSFEGDSLPPRVRRELVPIQAEASVDEDLLEDSRNRIVTWLQERGYWRARVSYTRRQTDNRQPATGNRPPEADGDRQPATGNRQPDGDGGRQPATGNGQPEGLPGTGRSEQADDRLEVVYSIARGRLYRVRSVQIGGARTASEAMLRQRVSLPIGQPFVPSALATGITAITQHYHDNGYPAVRVEQALVDVSEPSLSPDVDGLLDVRLRVDEGARATLSSVAFEAAAAMDESVLRSVLTVAPGQPFSSAAVVASREAVLRRYLDEGFRHAQIEARLDAGDTPGAIAVTFVLTEGRQTIVDRILVVGHVRTSEDTIRRELRIASGQPYGLGRVFESQRRLTALGLFRSVRITDVGQDGHAERDVVVTVEEAPVTTLGYGAGLQGGQRLRTVADTGAVDETFEFAARGFLEAGRRNLWGKNRTLGLFLRASVRPRDYPGDPDRDGSGLALNEYRVLGTWREPRAFGDSANLDVTTFVEQAIRSSFSFRRQQARVDWSRLLGEHTTFVARYGIGRTELFDARVAPEDQLNVDRLFPQVRISSVTSSVIRDTRDDPLDPGRGTFVAVDGELAGRSIGSEVGFNKTLLQGFIYRRLPGALRVVVAGGARLGLARGLPRELARIGDDGQPLFGPDGVALVDVVTDLPAAERFFAGGDNTVRGFAQDRLGEPATLDRNGLPTGGNALLIFNSEVRVPVWRGLVAAGFIDAGNVFQRVSNLDLARIRGAAGVGVRYLSPIGPIRVDLGFKLSPMTFANGMKESRTALHITVGQAF
ncbi:MAG: BamA/TamA family outer membrane protein [Acidobacteria bacterium]|nr:BamA/TamA family outer membrane protein [Acidobacteriota bacterium]